MTYIVSSSTQGMAELGQELKVTSGLSKSCVLGRGPASRHLSFLTTLVDTTEFAHSSTVRRKEPRASSLHL